MNIFSAGVWLGASTAIKMLVGLITIKVLSRFLGTEGLGYLGQVMGLVAVATLFAAGGISIGLTRYIAEHKREPTSQWAYLAAAVRIWFFFSLVFMAVTWLGAIWLSEKVFGEGTYAWCIVAIGVVQPLVGLHSLALGLINGYKNVAAYAWVTAAASVLGSVVTGVLTVMDGMEGAAWGLILTPAIGLLFSGWIVWHKGYARVTDGRSVPLTRHYLGLSKYGAMFFVSACTMPLAQIALRNLQGDALGWGQVGLWQGLVKVSDAYLQVVMAVLTVYYMPRLAELQDRVLIQREVMGTLKVVGVTLAAAMAIIYGMRRVVISCLYTEEFLPMEALFLPQMVGDYFRTLAYVIGFLVVAKAMGKVHVAAEIYQAGMLVLVSTLLLPALADQAVPYAYAFTYLLYFLAAVAGLRWYLRRKCE